MTKRSLVSFKIDSFQQILPSFEHYFKKLQDLSRSKTHLGHQTKFDIKTAFVEAVANAIKHGGEIEYQGFVEGKFWMDGAKIGFEVFDHGDGFDLDQVPVPDFTDFASSGRGMFMLRQLGDRVEYHRLPTHNCLVFERDLVGASEGSRELDLLYELSEAIVRQAESQEVYDLILTHALELFQVERASILMYDEQEKALKMVASRGIPDPVRARTKIRSGEGVSGYVYQHSRPLLIEDIDTNRQGIEKKEHYKTKSFISAPMVSAPLRLDERPLGVINLTDRLDGKSFTKKDLKLLTTIANQAMACLHIRNLVDEVKTKEKLAKEMEQIQQIQSSYLPKRAPQIHGYDLAGQCEMAESVGGDYFDYFWRGDDLLLLVADVSGHDLGSAITMVNFRSQLRAFTQVLQEPDQILTALNRNLHDDLAAREQFVSCTLLKLHLPTGKFVYASAGHYPPLLTGSGLPLPLGGLVLGIDESESYGAHEAQLEEGQLLFLYTDGIIEAMNAQQKLFGAERVQSFLEQHAQSGASQLLSDLVQQVRDHRAQGPCKDDITAVCLKRRDTARSGG